MEKGWWRWEETVLLFKEIIVEILSNMKVYKSMQIAEHFHALPMHGKLLLKLLKLSPSEST